MIFVVSVADSNSLDSCEYAVGGYCEDAAAAYFAAGVDDGAFQLSSDFPHAVTEGMTDICDMCGHLLPPLTDERLRQKHSQVQYASYSVTA